MSPHETSIESSHPDRGLHRRQLLVAVLVPVLLILPFARPDKPGALQNGLCVVALILAVVALGLLFTPTAIMVDTRTARGSHSLRSIAAAAFGRRALYAAASCAAIVLLDVIITQVAGTPLTG